LPGNATYKVQLTTNQGTVGAPAQVDNLPQGWLNTGDQLGTMSGNDGTPNGVQTITVGTTNITNVNFGIIAPKPDADVNITLVNTPIKGNVNTNDEAILEGSTYLNPQPNANNPSGSLPVFSADGAYTFTSTVPGVYNFNVPIVLSNGDTVYSPLKITVLDPAANNAPIANTDEATTPINTIVEINTLFNDKPGNIGSTLDTASVLITQQPSNGLATVNASTGVITYEPNNGFVGVDTLYYQVIDADGDTATAMQIITVLPAASSNNTEASDDFNTTPQDTPVSAKAIDNDKDPQGGVLSVVPQTVVVPEGTFSIDASGSYTFTPAPGFSGSVNFPYTVYDDAAIADSARATIYIVVLPKPTQNPDVNATWVNVPLAGDVSTNDKLIPENSTYVQPVSNNANPDGGTNIPVLNADGTYTFSSAVPGVYTWLVPVILPNGDTANIVELKITVLDSAVGAILPPVANTDLATTLVNNDVTLKTLVNDAAMNAGGTLVPSSVTIISAPKNGTASVDPITGEITYTPALDFVGVDTLFYSVKDNNGDSAVAMQIITIIAPANPNTTTASDDFNSSSTGGPVSGDALNNDMDAEGDTITVVPQTTVLAGQGTLTLLANGTYTFEPVAGFVGPVAFPYSVIDSRGATAEATLYFLVKPAVVLNTNAIVVNAVAANNTNKIIWAVTTNKDAVSYSLLRKANNATAFEEIYSVSATNMLNYNFSDNNFIAAENFYFVQAKLQNGNIVNSNTVRIANERNISVAIYPNPATDNITLQLSNPVLTENASVQIINNVGQIVSTNKIEIGTKQINISMQHLAAGTYTVSCKVDGVNIISKVLLSK
jgi:hypothetical protein